jgi:hypothetical protein
MVNPKPATVAKRRRTFVASGIISLLQRLVGNGRGFSVHG